MDEWAKSLDRVSRQLDDLRSTKSLDELEENWDVLTLSDIHENVVYQELDSIKEAQRKWIENSRKFTLDSPRRKNAQWGKVVARKAHSLTPRKKPLSDAELENSGDLTPNKPVSKKSIITPAGSTFGFCNVPNLKLNPSPVAATTFKPDKEYISEDGKHVKVLKIEEPIAVKQKERNPKKTKLVDTSQQLDSVVKRTQLGETCPDAEPGAVLPCDNSTNSLISKLNLEIKKVTELVEQNKKSPSKPSGVEAKKCPKNAKPSTLTLKKVVPEIEGKENAKSNSPKQKKYDLKVTRNFIKQKKKEREEKDTEEKIKKALESEEKKKKLLDIREKQRKILQTCKRRVSNEKPQWIGPLEFLPKDRRESKSPVNRKARGPATVSCSSRQQPTDCGDKTRTLHLDYQDKDRTQRIIRQNTEIIRRNRPRVNMTNKGDGEAEYLRENMISTSEEVSSLKTSKSDSALKSSEMSYVNYAAIDFDRSPSSRMERPKMPSQKRRSKTTSPLDPLKNVDLALKGEKRQKLNFAEDSKASLKLPMSTFLDAVPWENPLNDDSNRPKTPYWLKDLSKDPDPFNLINTFKRKLQMLEDEDSKDVSVQPKELNVDSFSLDLPTRLDKSEMKDESSQIQVPSVDDALLELCANRICNYSLSASKPDIKTPEVKNLETPGLSLSNSSYTQDSLKLSDSLERLNLRFQKLISGQAYQKVVNNAESEHDDKTFTVDEKSEVSLKSSKKCRKRNKSKNVLVRACSEDFESKLKDTENYATLSEFSTKAEALEKPSCSTSQEYYPSQSEYSSVNYPYVINVPYNVITTGSFVCPNHTNYYANSANYYESYTPTVSYTSGYYTPAFPATSSVAHPSTIPTAVITQAVSVEDAPQDNTTAPAIMSDKEKIVQKVYAESIFSDNNSSDSISEVVQVSRTLTRGNKVINNQVHTVTSQSVKGKGESDNISEVMEVTSLRSSIHDPPFDFEESSSVDKNITYTSVETYSPNSYEERPLEMKIAKITSQVLDKIPDEAQSSEHGYRSLSSYESCLIKKAKACIEEMESRRLKLVGKGKDSEASILKKKERALMLKLYEDLKEIFRLRKLEKAAGKTKKLKEELLLQVFTPQQKKDSNKAISPPLLKSELAIPDAPDIRLTTRELKEKEELLKERRRNVEAIVAWKQKLEQEERRVREMESIISRSPFNAPLPQLTAYPCTIDRGTSPLGMEVSKTLAQAEGVKQLCLMDSDNQNEYSDSFEVSSGLSEHTMKNVTVRSRHSSRVQYKRKSMTILKSPLSPRVTILKRRCSTGSDESITLSQNDTLSEQSDMEVRVSALQHQLKQRKTELEKLRKEYHKSQRERLRAKEQSLINQIQAYDTYIDQVKTELQNELEKPEVRVTRPQIKQPKCFEKKNVKPDVSSVVDVPKVSEVKEIKRVQESSFELESIKTQLDSAKNPEVASSLGSPVSEISTVFTSHSKETEISEHVDAISNHSQESEMKEVSESIPSSSRQKETEVSSPINISDNIPTNSQEISENIQTKETSKASIQEISENIPTTKETSKASTQEMSENVTQDVSENLEASSVKSVSEGVENESASEDTIVPEEITSVKESSVSPDKVSVIKTDSIVNKANSIDSNTANVSEIKTDKSHSPERISEELKSPNDQLVEILKSQDSFSSSVIQSSLENKTDLKTSDKSPESPSRLKSLTERSILDSLKSLSEYLPTFQTEEKSRRSISQLLDSKSSNSLSSDDMSLDHSLNQDDEESDVASEASNQSTEKSPKDSTQLTPDESDVVEPLEMTEKAFQLSLDSFGLEGNIWQENLEQLEAAAEETPLLAALQREQQQTLNVDSITELICSNIIKDATDAALAAFNRKTRFIHSQGDCLAVEPEGITIGRDPKCQEEGDVWHNEGLPPHAVKEAQELRMKQLQIEQEIEELEAQEVVPYYYMREIPNKPPPPYTPPKHSPPTKEETLSRVCNGVEIIWDQVANGSSPVDVELPEDFLPNVQDHPYREFMFDLSKELFAKFMPRPEESKLPWVVNQCPRKPLLPIRRKEDLLRYVEKEAKIVFGYEPKIMRENMIMKWSKKKRDLVDEILIKELQEEESEWTNFSVEENFLKNQIAESLIEAAMLQAAQAISKAFASKFASDS